MRWLVGMCVGIVLGIGVTLGVLRQQTSTISPIISAVARPLDRYSIPSLQKITFESSQIVLDEATATTSAYTVYTFHYLSEEKKVTGVMHIPSSPKPVNGYPVIVQFRGYVDQAKYYPGEGTERSAEVFAANGFISLAPDFLGYGGSDMPSSDVFEERFQTYTTALRLLASVQTLSVADVSRVGIWGHSNGGQIALTVLEVANQAYPAVLWAPVSKPFPYSILYYTDEADDHGKLLRRELAKFESLYDVELYSLTNYLEHMKGPIQIHQGSSDDAVPIKWTDDFVKILQDKNINTEYFTYPGADHNLTIGPARNASVSVAGGWNAVISRDIAFFRKQFGI